MKRNFGLAAATLLLGLLPGCVYSRVGGGAHEKKYRGSPEEVAKAVEAALGRHGFAVTRPEAGSGTVALAGTLEPEEAVPVKIRPAEDGLVEHLLLGGEAIQARAA